MASADAQRGRSTHVRWFPRVLRERGMDGVVDFGTRRNSQRPDYPRAPRRSQFEREQLISSDDRVIPPAGTDLGGMSGGPVFLVQDLPYPLVGLISEYSSEFELMRIVTLGHLPSALNRAAPNIQTEPTRRWSVRSCHHGARLIWRR